MRGAGHWAAAVALAAAAAAPCGDAQFTKSVGGLNYDGTLAHCNFAGTIRIKGASSMEPEDTYFITAHQTRAAAELYISKLNKLACGVKVGGQNFTLELTSIEDESSKDNVAAIAQSLVDDVTADFLVGPYSSKLNDVYASVINDTSPKVAVLAGASSTSVYAGRPHIFGTLPASRQFFRYAIPALIDMNATRFGYIEEVGAPMCSGVEAALAEVGASSVASVTVSSGPSEEELLNGIDELKQNGTDIILTCIYNAACPVFVKGLRQRKYTPKALVMSLCAGTSAFLEEVGRDAEHIMGVTAWDKSLFASDPLINMTAYEFFYEIRNRIGADAVYHTAASAGAISALVQAIQQANSIDPTLVAAELKAGGFKTIFGTISFDENNQFRDPYLLVQYNNQGDTPVVWPHNGLDMVYPMPTWESQDCRFGGNCSDIGECQSDGTCSCPGSYEPSGYKCIIVPDEDHQISPQVKAICMALFAINWLVSIGSIAWTVRFIRKPVVRASQPVFLITIAFGTMISSSTIPFIVIDDTNDEDRLAYLGKYTPANTACRLMLVTYTAGFVLTFAPLFAKLWRVKTLMASVKTLKRIRIRRTWLFVLIAGLLVVDLAIVVTWIAKDPLTYVREIISYDENGSPTLSSGTCTGANETPFIIGILVFHLSMLFFGVYLCFKTRNINSVMSESKYVAVAMISNLQVLALATPVLVIVSGEPVASMFLRSAVIFLNDFGVLMLIFVPKMLAQSRGAGFSASDFSGSDGKREAATTLNTAANASTSSG